MTSLSLVIHCAKCCEDPEFVCYGCRKKFCQHHKDVHQRTLDQELNSLAVDNDEISRQLKEEHIQEQYVACWSDIDIWEQEEIENIKRTANLMRQEIIDVVGECMTKPRKEIGSLMCDISSALGGTKRFDEIDLDQWAYLLDRVKKLAEFTVKLNTVDKGLQLVLYGKNLEDISSLENTDRHDIGLKPITSQQLQGMNHIQSNSETNPTTQNEFSSGYNIQSNETQTSRTPLDISTMNTIGGAQHQNNQGAITRLVRPRAAEIPFERRTFYPLRWRVNL
jgi:hypothetical protein